VHACLAVAWQRLLLFLIPTMEPEDPAQPGPFLRCREEGGVPVKLVGESDIFCLPATEELSFEAEDACVQDSDAHSSMRSKLSGRAVHSGARARLTTHRLVWRSPAASCWLALRLDAVATTGATGGVFRPRRCELRLCQGQAVAIRCSEAGRTEELLVQLQAAVEASRWQQGSYEAASIGGLRRILDERETRQQAVGGTLDVALADLESLKRHAGHAVAAARQVAAHMPPEGSREGAGVRELLEDFGLLGQDGAAVAQGGHLKADVDADVARVCQAALEKRGGLGMLLVHDVFCLVNRARGTAMLSPEELMAALRRCAAPGGLLRLRALGSTSALAASLARTSDRELDERLVGLAGVAPLSAFRLAGELGLTVAEAQYLLRDAEARAELVRDDGPEGVFFYPNFFAEL